MHNSFIKDRHVPLSTQGTEWTLHLLAIWLLYDPVNISIMDPSHLDDYGHHDKAAAAAAAGAAARGIGRKALKRGAITIAGTSSFKVMLVCIT